MADYAITTFDASDPYGRRSIVGAKDQFSDRTMRRWTHTRQIAVHRPKNGTGDPITYFHIIETVASMAPGSVFRAAELTDWLNAERPQLFWDSITVGKILNDVIESWRMLHRENEVPLWTGLSYRGKRYTVNDHPMARAILRRSLDDLVPLVERLVEEESRGIRTSRWDSPLLECPSMKPLVGMAN